MKLKIKKTLSIILIAGMLIFQVKPVFAEVPAPPSAPTAPSAPTIEAPLPPPPPPPPSPPATPEIGSASQVVDPTPTPNDNPFNANQSPSTSETTPPSKDLPSNESLLTQTTPMVLNGIDNSVNADGNVGNTAVNTGSALTSATSTINANTNINQQNDPNGGTISNSNDSNGSDSLNNSSVTFSSDSTSVQTNNGNTTNSLSLGSITGDSSASRNVGTSSIQTGNANTAGTAITAVNTNITGVAVSEFNILNDQTGDVILDFSGNCVINCSPDNVNISNTGNGAGSTNSATLDLANNSDTSQNNSGIVGTDMTLLANSGDNMASSNTGGDSTIQTGDANIAASALTFLNNNIAGNVSLGIINVFGNLIGDIILPDNVFSTCAGCAKDITAVNSDNGVNSTNNATINTSNSDNTLQSNLATITNNLNFSAITGENSTSSNTDGNSSIQTGNATIDAQTLNIANSNIEGGNWWLVIVNKAGEWIGQILGAPSGSTFGGSEGTQFTVGPDGQIMAVNSGNGSGSTNNANINQTNNNSTVQTNSANITNNLNLYANTGGNDASRNTGGNSSITTGDAKIIASLVNFVNNNIKSNGKLIVAVVNVFGNWFGDFVGPGQHKKETSQNQQSQAIDSSSQSSSPTVSQPDNSSNSYTSSEVHLSIGSSEEIKDQTSSFPVSSFGGYINNTFISSGAGRVAGISIINKDQAKITDKLKNKEKIAINLAWGVPLLPFFALMFIAIKRKDAKKFLIKKL